MLPNAILFNIFDLHKKGKYSKGSEGDGKKNNTSLRIAVVVG